jgi:aspartate/methionine/tyrosine aminotransferase
VISKRTQEIKPFIVMDVLEKAHTMERAGIRVVHLEVGEPDFDTPTCIKKAAISALEAPLPRALWCGH